MASPRRSTMRERPAIFRKTDEVIPELADEPAEALTDQPDAQAPNQTDNQAVRRPRVKVTVYLSPEAVIAIDELQIKEFQTTGKKPEKSDLVDRAIQAFKHLNGETLTQPDG